MLSADVTRGASWPRKVGTLSSALAVALGLIGLASDAIFPNLIVMPWASAAGLVCIGLAIWGVASERAYLIYACSIAAAAVVMFDRTWPVTMACFTILAAGIALAEQSAVSWKSIVLGVTGSLAAAAGAACFIGALGGLRTMPIIASVGVWGIGVGLTALAWSMSEPAVKEPLWLAAGGAVFAMVSRTAFWETFSDPNARAGTTSNLAWVAIVLASVGFGVVIHSALKAYMQRELVRRVNNRLQEEIAERRRAEQMAHAANQAKSEFLANMSHEIRTPMTGVLGMIDLLRSSELSLQQTEYLEMARSSADSLLALLNGILDLSKIEAGKLELTPAPFSIRQSVAEAIRTFDVVAHQKGLDLLTSVDADMPEILVGDPVRLRQVMVNLVGNSVKFTEAGHITVRIALESCAGADVMVRIGVTDTGPGIPPEKQRLIFDPFQQGDGSTTRRHGGTGLGLTISSRLVRLMGGELSVQSELGKGSTFSFTARLQRAPVGVTVEPEGRALCTPIVAHARSRIRPLRVLLAEDNVVNQKLVSELLKRDGHSVTVVSNGHEAVRESDCGDFDLVLMDVQMPAMDGLEATAEIRRKEAGSGKRVPIVAMTAYTMKGDEDRCIEAGMDDYLTKPIHFASLLKMAEKWSAREKKAGVTELSKSAVYRA